MRTCARCVTGLAGGGILAALILMATREPILYLALQTARVFVRLVERAIILVGPVNLF